MRATIAILVLVMSLSGCALHHTAPVLSPTVATAVTNGLTALTTILQRQPGVPASVFTAITDTQQAIAQDVNGTTWGGLLRTLLTDLYAQLPAALQNTPIVWASLVALEVALATVGA